jgi:hypothetical protein
MPLACLADGNLGAVKIAEARNAGSVHVCGRAGEDQSFRLSGGVEIIDVSAAQAELDTSRWILIGRWMKRQLGLASVELAPERRLEQQGHAQCIAVESNRGVHVADEFDRVIQAHGSSPPACGLRSYACYGHLASHHFWTKRQMSAFDPVILMVVAFAPIPWLLFRGRRHVAGAHVVFALHLYAFVLVLLCLSILIAWVWFLAGGGGLETPLVDTVLTLFNLMACAVYIYLAIGSAYGARGATRYLSAALLTGAVGVLFVGYRFVIFLITLYSTT